jgi:cell shape-determining protein MreC
MQCLEEVSQAQRENKQLRKLIDEYQEKVSKLEE